MAAWGAGMLTSNVGVTLEIAEGVRWLVDPLSEESIRIGLQRLIGDADLRNSLAKKGLERAAEFSGKDGTVDAGCHRIAAGCSHTPDICVECMST